MKTEPPLPKPFLKHCYQKQGCRNRGVSVKQTTRTGKSLKAITGTVNALSDINTRIASAIEEQSIAAEDINQNMVSIDNLARQGDGPPPILRQPMNACDR